MNTHSKKYSRNEFITFLGKVTLGATIIPPFLISCGNTSTPIKLGEVSNEQLERLKKWYGKLGHKVDENSSNYVFLKCTDTAIRNNERKTDIELSKRIKVVYEGADRDGYIILNNRRITNYSARHHFITQGLLRGVDIFTIALNAGTSVQYIEETYSKGLKTRMVSDELTKNLGIHRTRDDGSGTDTEN